MCGAGGARQEERGRSEAPTEGEGRGGCAPVCCLCIPNSNGTPRCLRSAPRRTLGADVCSRAALAHGARDVAVTRRRQQTAAALSQAGVTAARKPQLPIGQPRSSARIALRRRHRRRRSRGGNSLAAGAPSSDSESDEG